MVEQQDACHALAALLLIGVCFVQYIDYVGSWGPAIVGHAHPEVTAALAEQIKKVHVCCLQSWQNLLIKLWISGFVGQFQLPRGLSVVCALLGSDRYHFVCLGGEL